METRTKVFIVIAVLIVVIIIGVVIYAINSKSTKVVNVGTSGTTHGGIGTGWLSFFGF